MKQGITAVICLSILIAFSSCEREPIYRDKDLSVDRRVNDLLSRMTPEEKFFQLFMVPFDDKDMDTSKYKNGIFGFQVSTLSDDNGGTAILNYSSSEGQKAMAARINKIQRHLVEETRLGIPAIFFDEALHGLVRKGATSFPQSIAMAATFDTALMHEVASAIAIETSSRGIRQVLSPVVNIANDVRWGRTEETYGEDPLLTTSMGVAFVSEFEKRGIITTPKHFVANVGAGGRDSYPVDVSERKLEEYFFPPFEACIHAGGSRSVMTSYNSLNGVPNSQNNWLLNQKLKNEWGFKGFVISDANAVGGANVLHNTSADYATSGKQAIENGLDVIFQTSIHHYGLYIQPFVDGTIDQKKIDAAVARVLRTKFELGLFDQPYVNEDLEYDADKHAEIARKAASESIVLLKNDHNILPIPDGTSTLAVIGNDALESRLGGYSGPGRNKISILSAVDSLFDNVNFAEGCGREPEGPKVISTEFLSNEEGTQGLSAEYFGKIDFTDTPVVKRNDDRVDFSWTLYPPVNKLASHFYSVRWTGYLKSPVSGMFDVGLEGNDGFRLYIDDKLVVDRWLKQSYHRSMVPFRFEKDKPYSIKIEFFETVGNAQIKLIWSLQRMDTEAKIREAVEVARNSQYAVVVVGIEEGEFRDRASLSLPGRQAEMIRRVAETGVPTVVVVIGGSAITMNDWIDKVDAILYAWYPGEQGGRAVADCLIGMQNPGGKLPITFPMKEGQLPLVYNHNPTGRGDDYLGLTGKPLFPFGFGLSYTSFRYSNFKVSSAQFRPSETVTLTFDLENTGTRLGDEVVQLYVRDLVASVARPVIELKGFQRVRLMPGGKKTISFKVTPSMLSMLDLNLARVIEPGKFRLMIGTSSNDIRLQQDVEVIQGE